MRDAWGKNIDNPRYPHWCKITRGVNEDNFSDYDSEEQLIYEGECHSFTDTTILGNTVKEEKRKVSIPINQFEWEDFIPQVNDYVEVKIGKLMTEGGIVRDVVPDNYRTMVYYTVVRN